VAQIIQIPVSFEFRTTKVRWTEAPARVVGWRKKPDGVEDSEYLVAEVASAGEKRTIGLPLSMLTEDERKRCLATIGTRTADEAVKEICSALEFPYFLHKHKTYIEDADLVAHSQPADPWLMREDFLRCKPDRKAAMAFLNEWGRWRNFRGIVDLSEIIDMQRAVREALTCSPENWFASLYAFPAMKRSRSAKYPYFTMLTDACQVAIRMTTTIDLLRQLQFKTCARPDCGVPFPVTSNHKRDYCSQYCGHLESVRRSRKKTTSKQGAR
jgi:CGNR zinc finger